MPSSYVGAGIAQAAADVPDNVSRRQEARYKQTLANEKLKSYQAAAPVRESQQELQMQELKNQLRTSQANGLKNISYRAFDRYEGDKDTKHLNQFLTDAKNNPIGTNMFSGVVRYDAVENTKEGINMLKSTGIEDTDGYFEDPSSVGNMVIATGADGKKTLMDMDTVYASTGYTQYMDDANLERMNKRSLIFNRMRSGQSRERTTARERMAREMAEQEGIPVWQAYEILGKKAQGTTGVERRAQMIQRDQPGLSDFDAMEKAIQMGQAGSTMEREARLIADEEDRPYSEVFEELKTRKERTTSQKSVDEINKTKDELNKAFGGDFLNSDMSDTKQRRKAGRLVARIEKDFPVSAADRKTFSEIRQLTNFASTATDKITDEETGPLDSVFRALKKYVSNDIEGIDGTSAYEAFRNSMRHSLYGSALSAGETKAFNAAAGTLKEQTGPVMAQLRTQVLGLQSKLQAMYDSNDEYVAKYRFNMDLDQLASVIGALDERLEMIDTIAADAPDAHNFMRPNDTPPGTVKEYFNKPELGSLFNKGAAE